ncbi:hypothetical protein ABMA28_014787 [Loxostege sticticalis]|uniref:Regulatory protein zeste n=1 Tax=Loxostege sticticalis TaxID=481309 RepID=A0ABD0TC99_LOXSC
MPRSRKVNEKQMEILVDFAKTHQRFTMGHFGGSVQGFSYGQKEARKAWESVAVRLNAFGIKKTPDQWRRYWIEYKAKLKARAADSRREILDPGGKLVPLSDREKQLVELINRVAAEGLPVDVYDSCPSNGASSPEAQGPPIEVEWLDYKSESDDQLEEEIDSSQHLEPHADSEPETFQSAETEVEVAELVRKQRKSSYMRHFKKLLEEDTSRTKQDKVSVSDRHRELKRGSRFSEAPLQNNIASTSSSSHATKHEYEFVKKHSRASLNQNKSNETEDSDMAFFYSIVPEMKQMNPDQKRRFKMGVWSLVTQILQPIKMDSPSDHDYN